MFTATLFDYNGVLVDDELVHLAAFQDILEPLGITLSEKVYWDEYLGLDDAGAFERALRTHGKDVSATRIDELIEAKKPCYLRRAKKVLAGFPGAAELVRAQAQLGPVVIVSGALEEEIELGLATLGVRSLVQGIVSAESTQRSKPDPEGYLLGLKRLTQLGVPEPKTQTVVFEDSIDGVVAAKLADLPCVGVGHSYPAPALLKAGADVCVDKIEEVNPILLAQLFQSLS